MADVPTEADYTFRIVVIGDSGTGKTSMLKCFSDGPEGKRAHQAHCRNGLFLSSYQRIVT